MSTPPDKKDHWFRDMLTYGGHNFPGIMILGIIAILAWTLLPNLARIKSTSQSVIIYTSQDEEYAAPILKRFTDQTGIQVRAVYDNEAAKTVGLVNRIIAEKNNPQCDVFWNNEELRTRQLARDGTINSNWVSFGVRTRRIVVNTNLLPLALAPHDVLALTNKQFFGKVAIAYPMYGTTSAHFLALRQYLGESGWETWCRALAANKPFVVDGNSVVVKMVGKGEAIVGLTDNDDVINGQHDGQPVDSVLPTNGGFEIPNTAAVIANAPRPTAAQRLVDYLKSPEVLADLRKGCAIEPNVDTAKSTVNWDDLLKNQNANIDFMKGVFLR